MFNEQILEKSNNKKIKAYKIFNFFFKYFMWIPIVIISIFTLPLSLESLSAYICLLIFLLFMGGMSSVMYYTVYFFSSVFKLKQQQYLSLKNKTYQLTDTYVTDIRTNIEIDLSEDGDGVTREKIISFNGLPLAYTTSITDNRFSVGDRVVVQTFESIIKGKIRYPIIEVWKY